MNVPHDSRSVSVRSSSLALLNLELTNRPRVSRRLETADPAPVLSGSNKYPIEPRFRPPAGKRSNIRGQNTRALSSKSHQKVRRDFLANYPIQRPRITLLASRN
eukprot:789269-Pyramimonas_sp.AAC.1